MAQAAGLSLQIFASGFCEAHANVVNPKEGKGKATFYALWALLHVPELGYVLFDTGYSEAFNLATRSFPARFYRWATPVTLSEKNTAKNLLAANGIATEQIKYVIISHFHADHIAGLKDFTQAQFICTKTALEQVQQLSGFKAVSKGILHGLLPQHFDKQVVLLETFADHISINQFGFTEYQLFGITQFKLVLLPGHAKGMLGFIYQDQQQALFYATDAAWQYDTYKRGILPRKIVKLFFDSWADYLATLQKIQAFELANPQFKVIFTHCPRSLEYVANEL